MSLRRLRILIEHLPAESATKTALRNAASADELRQASQTARPDLAPWSNTEMLLAAVLDEIRHNTAVVVAANGGAPAPVKPTPRPGITPASASPKRLTAEQRRAIDPRLRNQPQEA